MNELATQQSREVGQVNGNFFQSYGDQVSQKSIVGKLLKFSKGDFLVGEDNDEVAEGTQYVANMDELMVGWIKWSDSKPEEQIMGRVSEGYQAPKRSSLGDDDKSRWEVDEQGRERDPWQFSNYLILKTPGENDEDNLFTFTTSSRGGLNAIGELCKAYGKAMRQRPDEFPIIALKVGSYQHSNKAYGRIKFPIFEVVGWAGKAEFAEALDNEAPAESAPAPAKKASAKGAAQTRF
jgi:hypothetical protein